ncbi:MAG TPA: LytTR family DNA-binding domain-containing protein [Steroidobacteraceae bacterium]|nr:LytTR family DNA-binding domain-containing protein [Steroidobacteraceae bacterium]
MKLAALVVDDEPPARARLRALLGELADIEVAGEAPDGETALRLCLAQRPDIVFLDVRMPGMDGLELARHLALLPDPPAVVFTTAYDEHAMAAFDAQAIGYLLKPVRKEKLAHSVSLAQRLTRTQLTAVEGLPAARGQLAIRIRDGLKLVRVEDVLCFTADQKYTTVNHLGGADLIEDSLRTLEAEFAQRFTRIHRNTLVNTRRIEAIERNEDGQYHVRLQGMAELLPVSRRLAGELKDRFHL